LHKNQRENNLKVRRKKSNKRKEKRKIKTLFAFKNKDVVNYINNNGNIISLSLIKFYNNEKVKQLLNMKEILKTLNVKLKPWLIRCKLKRLKKNNIKRFKKSFAILVIREKQKHEKLKK
jgi:hypothetical protein